MSRQTKNKPMLLNDLLALYVDARNAGRPINATLSEKTRKTFVEAVRAFTKFLARPALVDDLNAKRINEFLRYQFVNGKSEFTVKNRRTHLRALWNYAHKCGLLPPWEGVQAVQVNPLNIKGFDQATITHLVEYAAGLRGTLRSTGLRKADWWETFVLVLWETAMRSGDMLYIEPQHFDKAGWLWVVEHKTSKRGWRRLRPSVAERLAEFIDWEPSRARVWIGYNHRSVHRAFANLLRDAGIYDGSMRWVRRGSASEVEKAQAGAGWRFLKHSVPMLFDKHYRVDKIVEERPILPPEINAKVFRPKRSKPQ